MKKLKPKIASYKGKDGKYIPAFIISFPDGRRKNTFRVASVYKKFDTKSEANKYALSEIKYFSKK